VSVINYSLNNVQTAYSKLGPYDFRTIHIAGTNGKGSVCTFLELLYLNVVPDLKVGKYTSPHIWSVTERFSVNGKDISQEEFEKFGSGLELEGSGLTEFEKLTLIGFEYFKQEQVDIVILETGLGGRFDATNVIPVENRIASAITNVAMDHMDYLGNSIEEIRREKEGICRSGICHFEGSGLGAHGSGANPNDVRGSNFLLALEIFESINKLIVSDETKQEVLKQFPQRHRARFEYNDGVLIDVAHNPAAMKKLNHFIQKDLPSFERKIFVLAFLDKDYQACLDELLTQEIFDADRDLVILTEIDSSRATPAFVLDEIIDANKMMILNPQEAIATAKGLKTSNDLVIITGSIRLVEACKAGTTSEHSERIRPDLGFAEDLDYLY
jgi:folylpolyglutamate synthase/dihydropteroate synthase